MADIKLKVNTNEREVEHFLESVHTILDSEEFDIHKDVTVILSTKSDELMMFSNYYTIVDLEYDISDIVERIKELIVSDFSERIVDKDDLEPPALFVFGKEINKKQVYIKLKIKNNERNGRVLIISFHYAEHKMLFPFAKSGV